MLTQPKENRKQSEASKIPEAFAHFQQVNKTIPIYPMDLCFCRQIFSGYVLPKSTTL
ncbi:hypothetical protein LguiA_007311 [Lonicera macranthoides]